MRAAINLTALKNERGMALATVYMVAVVALAGALMFGVRAMSMSRQSVHTLKSDQSKSLADAGVQLGIARLSQRLSHLEAQLKAESPTETQIRRYDRLAPGEFWTNHLNKTKDGTSLALAGESPFVLIEGGKGAEFTIKKESHDVTVRLFYANAPPDKPLGPPFVGRASLSAGYNDVWLRYRYEIDSRSKVDAGNGKFVERVSRVRSYGESLIDAENTIQVHLSRSLTRYNLFAIHNEWPDGTPSYLSYNLKGRVYSQNRLYIEGSANPGNPFAPFFPSFNSTVEISQPQSAAWVSRLGAAAPSSWPAEVVFRKSNGKPLKIDDDLMFDVKKIDMPGEVAEEKQCGIAQSGVPEPAVISCTKSLADGVYAKPAMSARDMMVYVKGDVGVKVRMQGDQTAYDFYQPHTAAAPSRTILQDVSQWDNATFLIFVHGELRIDGEVAPGTKLTAAATDNIIVAGDLVYGGGIPNDNTVIGLLSWQKNILMAHKVPGISPRNVYLHAVLMAPNGGFGAEGWDGDDKIKKEDDFLIYTADGEDNAYRGTIYHIGSQIRKYALPTIKQISGSMTSAWGWELSTEFDADLESTKAPPYFPSTGPYRIEDKIKVRVVDIFKVL